MTLPDPHALPRKYTDPGWGPAIKPVLRGMLPWVMVKEAARDLKSSAKGGSTSPTGNGLVVLRILFLAFVLSLLLFAFVLYFIVPFDGGDERWVPFAVGAVGLGSLGIGMFLRSRPLDGTSARVLGGSYRSSMFVRIAVAEAAAMAGFVGAFVSGSLWVYLLGLAFALLGLAMAAPGRRDVAARQEQLYAQRSSLDLLSVLVDPPASPASKTV